MTNTNFIDNRRPQLQLIDALKMVSEEHGVSYATQIREIFALSRSHIKLQPEEYFYYRLFLADKDMEEKKRFIGKEMQRAIFLSCNHFLSWQVAADKLYFYSRMQAEGVPTPKNYALIHARPCTHICPVFIDRDSFEPWFFHEMPTPAFCKPAGSASGDTAFLIETVDSKSNTFVDGKGQKRSFDDLWQAISRHIEQGVLVQEALPMLGALADVTQGKLATVRLVVLLTGDGARISDAAWRIPANGNRIDNFRAEGNILAGLDVASGKVTSALQRGMLPMPITVHPDTGKPLLDITVPDWEEVKRSALQAAPLFHDIRLQSWDIALTDKGPVCMEMNPGGNIDNCQVTERSGLWQGDFIEFVRECYRKNQNDAIRYPRKHVEKMLFG